MQNLSEANHIVRALIFIVCALLLLRKRKLLESINPKTALLIPIGFATLSITSLLKIFIEISTTLSEVTPVLISFGLEAFGNFLGIFLITLGIIQTAKMHQISLEFHEKLRKTTQNRDQLQQSNQNLENNLNRTMKELEETVEHIQSQKTELELDEKLQALNEVFYKTSNELEQPLKQIIENLSKQHFEEKEVLSQLSSIKELEIVEIEDLKRLSKARALSIEKLTTTASFIQNLKQLTRKDTPKNPSLLQSKAFKDAILIVFNQFEKSSEVQIDVAINDDFQLNTYPGHIYKILEHLFENSLLFSFDSTINKPKISIQIKGSNQKITLVYGDNGVGLQNLSPVEIFSPFFSTRKSEGSLGLGLTITKNLLENQLSGDIEILTCSPHLQYKIELNAI